MFLILLVFLTFLKISDLLQNLLHHKWIIEDLLPLLLLLLLDINERVLHHTDKSLIFRESIFFIKDGDYFLSFPQSALFFLPCMLHEVLLGDSFAK